MQEWPRVTRRSRPASSSGGGGFVIPVEIWYGPTGDIFDCCVAAYQSIGVPGYDESKWNLRNVGTNDLTEGIAPGWDAFHGWQFDASSGTHLKTGVIPDQNYSYVVRFTNHDTADVNSVFGMYGATESARIDLWCTPALGGMVWWYGTAEQGYAPITSQGIFGLAGSKPYRDGLVDGADLPLIGWAEPGVELYLGAVNDNGAPRYQNTVNIQAFAVYSCTLDEGQMAAVMAAMAHL